METITHARGICFVFVDSVFCLRGGELLDLDTVITHDPKHALCITITCRVTSHKGLQGSGNTLAHRVLRCAVLRDLQLCLRSGGYVRERYPICAKRALHACAIGRVGFAREQIAMSQNGEIAVPSQLD